jgi:LPXTG-motif cell wall-anchored protein
MQCTLKVYLANKQYYMEIEDGEDDETAGMVTLESLDVYLYKIASINTDGEIISIEDNFKGLEDKIRKYYSQDQDNWNRFLSGSILRVITGESEYSVTHEPLRANLIRTATQSSPANFGVVDRGLYYVTSKPIYIETSGGIMAQWGIESWADSVISDVITLPYKLPANMGGTWRYDVSMVSKISGNLGGSIKDGNDGHETGTDEDSKDPGGGEEDTDPTPDPDPDPDTPSKTPEDFDDPPGDGSVSSTDEIPEDNPHDETGGVSDNPQNADATTHVTELVPVSSQDTPGVVTSQDTPKLPQTGMQLWLVPLLLAAGLVLVAAGLVRRRAGQGASAAADQGAGTSDTFDTKTAGGGHIYAQNVESVTSNNITSPPTPSRDSGRRA